ncbi:granzyme K-like [Conger conger]|uniref:granzyme K-like n=1 Tax=Conger conger TaxID=82655 RepID=UPI002A5ADA94|nr:granzyme K-like [Conger conger]
MSPLGPAALILLQLLSSWKPAACSGAGIVGGKEVKPHSCPWMVSLQVRGQHVCGGVLVKDQWVLTAAHCESAFGGCTAAEAVLGAHSLKKDTDVQRLRVQACISHGTFKPETVEHDIMLLKLKTKVKMKSKKIKVKDLPKSGKDVPAGTSCHVTGWGLTNGKHPSDTLRGADVKIEGRDLCSCYYKSKPVITTEMLCAGNKKTNEDACSGDSGGPLLCQKVLVGVVSGGTGCGDPKKPGVYTRLSEGHLSWIKKVIKHRSNISISQTFT